MRLAFFSLISMSAYDIIVVVLCSKLQSQGNGFVITYFDHVQQNMLQSPIKWLWPCAINFDGAKTTLWPNEDYMALEWLCMTDRPSN